MPLNLLIVSMMVFLTAVSTAPVEEKELEDVEVEATEEGEVSEEEEDDDDSKSQDKIEGALGGQQTTMVGAAAGGSAPSGQSAGGGTREETAGSSTGSTGSGGPAGYSGSAVGAAGSVGSTGSAAGQSPDISMGLSQSAGAERPAASSHTETNGSDRVDSESNGNGQKFLNGGGGGVADSQTGVMGSFGGGVSHLDYIGSIDPSSHDFLLGLMGAGDPFSPDHHIHVPGNMTPPTHLDNSRISSDVSAAPHAHQNGQDSPADPAHHSDITFHQSGPDHSSLTSESDQSQSSAVAGSFHTAGAAASSHSEAVREQTDGADSPDHNGNGRQTLLTDTNRAVTDRLVSFSDLQTDLAGGAESVTGVHVDLTASGLELGRDVTESPPIMLHTESVDITHTMNPVSGVYPHTDLVTMTTDLSGTGTVAADPTGTPLDSSVPAVTDHTQMVGSVTEQYNPSGQGPEGAENVELEDTC